MISSPPLIIFDKGLLCTGSRKILRTVSWELHRRQQWVVLGPQGSGKSAFARLAAGLIPQSSGRIEYAFDRGDADADPEDFIAYAAFGAAILTDDYFLQSRYWSEDSSPGVADFLSQENVFGINPFEIRPLPVEPRRYAERLHRIAALLCIQDLLDKELHQLSNGEARKIMLAKTLLLHRRIVVLDDPFGGLDAGYRKLLGSVINGLAATGTQFIIAMDDTSHLPACMTHCASFNRGTLERSGPVADRGTGIGGKRHKTGIALPAVHLPRIKKISPKTGHPLVMQNVNVVYGEIPILSNISWKVQGGERWCITGPNGAGKTTLLSLILGDHPQAYSNDIQIFGKQWGDRTVRSAIRRRIGWVSPELLSAFPLSERCLDAVCSGIFDTLGLFGRCPTDKRRGALAWMSALGIGQCAGLPLEALSQGLQRVVLIARALVKQPELLILDEPFLGLDGAHAQQVVDCIDGYCTRSGATLIMVTHEKGGLVTQNMKNLMMRNGRIVRKTRD